MIVTQPKRVQYESIGFKSEWEDFMKQRFQLVIDKHSRFLIDYSDKLASYMNANPNSISPVQKSRIQNIMNLVAVRAAFTNPYP